MENKLFKKLKEVNKPKEFIIFKLEYKNKVVHEKKIVVPGYGKDLLKESEVSLYYFFKDMASILEEKIVDAHKKMILEKSNEKSDNAKKG